MTPTMSYAGDRVDPNFELLRRDGWLVGTFSGSYCLAFRGRDEAIFQWANGAWLRLGCGGG